MDPAKEHDLWEQIEQAQIRIRDRVFRIGMAAALHMAKGSAIVNEPKLLEHFVFFTVDEEKETAEYLASLPGIIERTKVQDERCADTYASAREEDSFQPYFEEQARLSALLESYRYRLRYYEDLVAQPKKPLLDNAKALLNSMSNATDEVRKLELRFRMSLKEFVAVEEANSNELALLDQLRDELANSFDSFARERAHALAANDPEALRFARLAVRAAVRGYSHRRGYRFTTYAQHWIRTGIRNKKTWGRIKE